MGKHLKEMGKENDAKQVKNFSEKCLTYTKVSSQLIKDYGGTVIYAGGDDLLFLTPIQSESKNLFANVFEDIQLTAKEYLGAVKELCNTVYEELPQYLDWKTNTNE